MLPRKRLGCMWPIGLLAGAFVMAAKSSPKLPSSYYDASANDDDHSDYDDQRRRKRERNSNQRREDEYYQTLSDAEQREHEDRGEV